uniref:Uncharacterized protein n=1 Tax=Anguilla anguilla TaxID=7936 RepID=A0A0E9SKP4_ANGAN
MKSQKHGRGYCEEAGLRINTVGGNAQELCRPLSIRG